MPSRVAEVPACSDAPCHLGASPEVCISEHLDALIGAGLNKDWRVRVCPVCARPESTLWIRPGTSHRVDWFCEMECHPVDIRNGLLNLGVHEACLGGYCKAEHAAALVARARLQGIYRIPRNLNGRMYRVCVQAVAECDDPPANPLALLDLPAEEFHSLAERAGIGRAYRYRLYKKLTGPKLVRAIEVETQELYRHYDANGRLLYLGISGDRESREVSHRRYSKWWGLVAHSATEPFQGRRAVAVAEIAAIKAERPIFNKQHNDTPEARERLHAYLEEIGRMDLMWD